jgi:hypothetical protein
MRTISFFFLFITINIFQISAQNKFSINGYFSPDYCNTFASANNSLGDDMLVHRDTFMSAGFGLHSGIATEYKISEKISFGAGFSYSKHQFKGNWANTIIPDSLQAFTPTNYKNDDLLEFFQIPVYLKYDFSNNDFKCYTRLGLTFQQMATFLIYSTVKYTDGTISTKKSNELEYYKRFNMKLIGGFGLSYQFHKHLSVNTEVVFRYSLFSLNREINKPLTEHFYSIGLQTGIAWHF